jgi:DNA-binding NtrC family response regulator
LFALAFGVQHVLALGGHVNHIEATANGSEATLGPHPYAGSPEITVLVVEDENFVREITCDVLEAAGFRVLKAGTADEARTVFRRHRKGVQLMLTDVVLPGQNGRDLAGQLSKFSPTLVTILVSGYPVNAVTREGLWEEKMFYLPKPYSAESLLDKVREVLGEERLPIHAGGR